MKRNLTLGMLAALSTTTLTCPAQPGITQQPASTLAYVGSPASFKVTATGTPPLAYQWLFNGADLFDKTSSSLSFSGANFTNAGPYSVVVSNVGGIVTSQTAWLSVLPTNVVNLGNRELQFGQLSAPIWQASRMDDGDQMISGDGLTLFYGSRAPGGSGDYDVWMTTRTNLASTNWSAPLNLGSTINSPEVDWGPRTAPDGLSFYLESTRPGGQGGYDIYVATRASLNAPLGSPVNLGPNVNSSADEGGAIVSADNRTLVFTAVDRPGGMGDYDIWMSTRPDPAAPWGKARSLAVPINSSYGEFPVALSRDGLLLFFKSWRPISVGPSSSAIYVCSRAASDQPFRSPALIRPILGIGTGGADLSNLSDDGKTLYVGTYREQCCDWPELVQLSVTSLPQLSASKDSSTGAIQLDLLGREGATYEIQLSEDLASWNPWLMTNAPGSIRLSYPIAPAGHQFYRVLSH